MSVHLIYFERAKYSIDSDYSKYGDVNNYSPPDIWNNKRITVVQNGKVINATIFFDGISSNYFYFYDKSSKGVKGAKWRNVLYDFINMRLKNNCIDSFVYLDIFNCVISEPITIVKQYNLIDLIELDKVFRSGTYKGLYSIKNIEA